MATTTPSRGQASAPRNSGKAQAGSTSAQQQSADPWALASGNNYDPDTIYTRASDDKGHHALMHVKVSPTLHGEIRALIQSGKVSQYRTHADIVRDALIHRMVYIRDMLQRQGVSPGTLGTTLDTEIREAEIDEIEIKVAHWGRLIDKLDNRLTDLIHSGDYDTAWYLIDRNQDPQDMSGPFVARLAAVVDKHTRVLESISNRLPVVEDMAYDPNVVAMRDAKMRRSS